MDEVHTLREIVASLSGLFSGLTGQEDNDDLVTMVLARRLLREGPAACSPRTVLLAAGCVTGTERNDVEVYDRFTDTLPTAAPVVVQTLRGVVITPDAWLEGDDPEMIVFHRTRSGS